MPFPARYTLPGLVLTALLLLGNTTTLPAQAAAQRAHVSVMVSGAVSTRTASHNETIDGAFRTLAIQLSRPLFTVRGVHIAWLGEVMPAMLVTAGAPLNRVPTPGTNAAEANDPRRLERYAVRDSYGVGFAPFGAEAAFSPGEKTHLLLNVTAGGGVVLARGAVRQGDASQLHRGARTVPGAACRKPAGVGRGVSAQPSVER